MFKRCRHARNNHIFCPGECSLSSYDIFKRWKINFLKSRLPLTSSEPSPFFDLHESSWASSEELLEERVFSKSFCSFPRRSSRSLIFSLVSGAMRKRLFSSSTSCSLARASAAASSSLRSAFSPSRCCNRLDSSDRTRSSTVRSTSWMPVSLLEDEDSLLAASTVFSSVETFSSSVRWVLSSCSWAERSFSLRSSFSAITSRSWFCREAINWKEAARLDLRQYLSWSCSLASKL